MQFVPTSMVLASQAQQRLFDGVRLDSPVEIDRPRRVRRYRLRTAVAGSLQRVAGAVAPPGRRPAM